MPSIPGEKNVDRTQRKPDEMVRYIKLPSCRILFKTDDLMGPQGVRLGGTSDRCPFSGKPSLEDCAYCSEVLPESKMVLFSSRTCHESVNYSELEIEPESMCDLMIWYWPDSVSCSRGPSSRKCEYFPNENQDEDFDYELDYIPDCSVCPVVRKARTQVGLLSPTGLDEVVRRGGYSYLQSLFPDAFSVLPAWIL